MTDFTEHSQVLEELKQAQEAEFDLRTRAREAHLFVDKVDGQWEPHVLSSSNNRPRYTFDMVAPVVDQVVGEIEQADFDIRVSPAGGDATKDTAKLLDGIVRNVENISNAKDIYCMSARNMVTGGIDGWVIKQEYADDDSFDQDLVIRPLSNFVDSVYLGPFTRADGSDARWAVVLEAIPKKVYEKRWPKGSGQSVDQSRLSDAYYYKHEHVIVGQLYYIAEADRELMLLSDGRVIENNKENLQVIDELAAAGVTIVQTRKRKKKVVKTRLFDGQNWLNSAQTTVFDEIPVIPCIANFKTFENKVLYRGVVEKLIDPQRVFNYAKSREIEEGALAPREKYWMTPKQASGHESTLATMNTNADPVQFYNNDPESPGPPAKIGGASINPGLNSVAADMQGLIRSQAGMYDANMGDNPGLQSGVAIERLQNKGDNANSKYIRAVERAVARTGRILVRAIPRVYDRQRQIRILNEDGSFDMQDVNQPVMDYQTGQMVVVNDLSQGTYDVICSAGPSFRNRQQESVQALIEMGQVDPSIIDIGGDILYKNLQSPGMDLLSERKRRVLFQQGMIPFQQMTDEEKQEYQQMLQQPPPPDPAMLLAQAEIGKAEADKEANLVKSMAIQREQDRKDMEMLLRQQNEQARQQRDQFEQQMKVINAAVEQLATQAQTLKTIREALGAEAIMSPEGVAAYRNQTGKVIDAQRGG